MNKLALSLVNPVAGKLISSRFIYPCERDLFR